MDPAPEIHLVNEPLNLLLVALWHKCTERGEVQCLGKELEGTEHVLETIRRRADRENELFVGRKAAQFAQLTRRFELLGVSIILDDRDGRPEIFDSFAQT